MAAKSPTVDALSLWLEEELKACRFNFAEHNASGQSEIAGFWARRAGCLEAAGEVIYWFNEESK